MNDKLTLEITIDEDGWVGWQMIGADGSRGTSGNERLDEFAEFLEKWKESYYSEIPYVVGEEFDDE